MFKKTFLVITILIQFVLPLRAWASTPYVLEEQIEAKTLDRRAQILQAYLTKYNSPLQYHAQDFIDAANTYNLDWRLVAAISGVESTFGKFVPGGSGTPYSSYNGWGWGVYGTQAIYFKSWREGIFTVSAGLRINYLNKGLTDPLAMNRVYAASPAWGGHVNYFLADMKKFQNFEYQDTASLSNLTARVAGNSAELAFKPISSTSGR
ncbi:MAG: hypothetical protein Q7S44_01155 [bacterium]|nr:hypothetical protein [bacterium]